MASLELKIIPPFQVIILGFVMWMFDALSFYAIYDLVLRVRNN